MGAEPEPQWSAGWVAQQRAQRRAWAATTPDERLRWLEEALELALVSGALQRERARRAAATPPSA